MVVLHYAWRLLSSRVGIAAVLCALLWAWHGYDKRQAVRAARDGYVAVFELAASQAELAAIRQRVAAAELANQQLNEKVQVAEGQAIQFAAELEAFERDTKINPDGVVDADLVRRLRAN